MKYRSYGNLDSQFQADGDLFFDSLDLKHDRSLLPAGTLAKSINKRLRTGAAVTRAGTRTPTDFNPAFAYSIRGSGVFSNPSTGVESLLVAEANRGYVYEFRDGVAFKTIRITGGGVAIAPDDFPWFVQAFDKVLMLRTGLTPLVWDGLDYAVGFKPVTKSDPADTSTVLIPTVGYGIPFQNRVLYKWGRDMILMSDVLDYTSYDPVLSVFRINAGEGDSIVSIHPYSAESVLVFMQRSIHRLSNFTIDSSLARQEVVIDSLGGIGREGAVQVGADIIFLSRSGFYRVNQVFENQTVSAPVPISDAISPLLEGINWEQVAFIGMAALERLGDYVFAAVPIGRNYPRNVLVYNTVTSKWESVDAWQDTNFYTNWLRVTLFDGERRLFGINAVTPHIYLLYEGVTDQTPATFNVNDIIETRAYGAQAGPQNVKRFDRLALSVRTNHPSFSVYSLTDGYNEEKNLTPNGPITKSTTKFYTWGHKDFASGDDPNEPKRQDYYTGSETEWVAQDMSNLIPGQIDLLPAVEAEMLGGPTTESLERRMIRQIGRWCSIRIANTQGTCDVLGVTVDMEEKERVVRVAA